MVKVALFAKTIMRYWPIILVAVLEVVLVSCYCESAPYDVSLEVTAPSSVYAGRSVQVELVLTNTGTTADRYKLEIILPTGWEEPKIPRDVDLAAGDTRTLFLTIEVSSEAAPGRYEVKLRAISLTDRSVWDEVEFDITVLPPPEPPLDVNLDFLYEMVMTEVDWVRVDELAMALLLAAPEWTIEIRSSYNGDGFSSLSVSSDVEIGQWQVNSSLDFDALTRSFDSARFDVSGDLPTISCDTELYLDTDSSYVELGFEGGENAISWESTMKYALCPVVFEETTFSVDWELAKCGFAVEGLVEFTCEDGFDSLEFGISDISLPFCAPELCEVSLDLEFAFSIDDMECTADFEIDISHQACEAFSVSVDLVTTDLSLDAISITEIAWEQEITEEVWVTARASFGYGKELLVELAGPIDVCAEFGGAWELAVTFFEDTTTSLFGWKETELQLDVPITEGFLWTLDCTYRYTSPHWEIRFGFGGVI